jgi:hypothetical protein
LQKVSVLRLARAVSKKCSASSFVGANPMTESPEIVASGDIPGQVFDKFLEALRCADVSPELIARLRKALLEDKTFTDRTLKAAVLGEEQKI